MSWRLKILAGLESEASEIETGWNEISPLLSSLS